MASNQRITSYANVAAALAQSFDAHGARVAFRDLDTGATLTYAELDGNVAAVREELSRAGLGPGATLLVCMENSSRLAALILAGLWQGACLALLDAEIPDAQLADYVRLVGPEAVVRRTMHIDGVRNIDLSATPGHATRRTPDSTAQSPAFAIFSSGTTGQPKGVVHTHANILAELDSMLRAYAFDRPMQHGSILTYAHVSGLYRSLLMPLLTGGTIHMRRKLDPQTFWRDIADGKIEFVQLVPSHVAILNRSPAEPAPSTRTHLGFIGTASAYLPPADQAAFETRFGIPLLQGYGLTECTCGIALNSLDPKIRRPGVAGLPLDVNRVRIVDAAGIEMDVGEVGELQVTGPNVASRFIGTEPPSFVDGWLQTGDLGRIDPDGNIVLVGRAKTVISRGAYKIFPLEIEEALCAIPGIRSAAAVGVPHPILGQDVVAYVTSDAPIEPPRLLGALRSRVASYKVPTQILQIDALPVNKLGKVVRDRLVELYVASRTTGRGVDVAAIGAKLTASIAQLFAVPPVEISLDTPRTAIAQWDSLGHVQLLAMVEDMFDVRLSDEAAMGVQDIRQLLDLVVHDLKARSSSRRGSATESHSA